MTHDDPRLPLLGDALREAATVDLARNEKTQAGPARSDEARSRRHTRPRFRIGTRTAVALVAAALAVPAAAPTRKSPPPSSAASPSRVPNRPAPPSERGWNTNARSTPTS
jgi:hypothetical protein